MKGIQEEQFVTGPWRVRALSSYTAADLSAALFHPSVIYSIIYSSRVVFTTFKTY